MTVFYKIVTDGYIDGFGTNGPDSEMEITEAEYNELTETFQSRPSEPEGYIYKLQADPLEWVLVERSPDPDEDLDSDELMRIILGGAI